MANQLSGQPGPSPICHRKHERHAAFGRLRVATASRIGQDHFVAFLNAQATRLSTTATAIFTFLKKNTADRIRNATNTGQLS